MYTPIANQWFTKGICHCLNKSIICQNTQVPYGAPFPMVKLNCVHIRYQSDRTAAFNLQTEGGGGAVKEILIIASQKHTSC